VRNISDTIRRLSSYKFAGPHVGGVDHRDRLADLPAFGSNPGQLRARIHVPHALPASAPLVVVLHGCTQSAAAYDNGAGWSHLADRNGFALLFPEQQRTNNPNLCFNWFVPDDIRRDGGEAASIRQMVEAMVRTYGLDRARIYITGLSAGGAMTAVMLAAYPEVFAGGAVIAGLPFGCAATIPEAFDRMRGHGGPGDRALQTVLREASPHEGPWPVISIWHGSADHTVAISNMDRTVAQWQGVHQVTASPTFTKSVSGHERRCWRDISGKTLIETHVIPGMGHGTPIDTRAVEGRGIAGPFMLDVGISSTLQIANFWGLVPAVTETESQTIRVDASTGGRPMETTPQAVWRANADTGGKPQTKPASRIAKVIEDALRAAGLMS
jgi:poly(hydroxyalkanoate) depolymerase family esterase